ncbi:MULTISPECIES: hypothetical protein [Actinomyces]|uniref:hypothetical protein n=1 Tax=Actinomyces TaxID=1654 RepID=UPI00109DC8CB|nr:MULTISPECIES: hypothetical protein [Actinomyces]
MTIWFIDSSVLDHLVPVPGWSKPDSDDRRQVKTLMKQRTEAGDRFVLPITAVVETGNHICQVKDGDQRRQAAVQLEKILGFVVDGKAPWALDEVQWDEKFLRAFLNGGSTGQTWVQLATQGKAGLGGGDLTLVVERDQYCERTGIPRERVEVWTLDAALKAYR